MADARWIQRPPTSNWGDFGRDDEVGRLNLITEATVLKAFAEVRVGRTFCLSLPLTYPGGSALSKSRRAPRLAPVMQPNGRPSFNYRLRCDDPQATDVFCDDEVTLSLQYSTHWDGLSHVGQLFDLHADGQPIDAYYNGFRADNDVAGPAGDGVDYQGARRLGIENMAERCVQGRGVMIDLEAHCGRAGEIVGYDRLMRIVEADQITVEAGDFVCLRTGFAQHLLEMRLRPDRQALFSSSAALDGRDKRLQDWITTTGLVALIADNYAVEALPARPGTDPCCSRLPLHEHCLFRLGVYLGELWHLSDLAEWLRAHNRSRFLLTAPPLRLPGAVGSPVTPIATV